MDEQELIQVNLQLPASALDGLSRLTEQLRKLTAVISGLSTSNGVSEETVESGFFDPARFQALREQSGKARFPQTESPEARAVRSDISADPQDPKSAGWEPESGTDTPNREIPDLPQGTDDPKPVVHRSDHAREEANEDIPVVRPEMEEQVPEAREVRMEPDSQIPEAEEAWAQAGNAELPLPAARAEISEGAEAPLGAGVVVTAQPEPPGSRWTGLTEELVTAGPAPLTAEAVSLAFQRDGRRYDNGFPLY